ncbi:MAG: glycoside hydrolase family 9 protein [Burkholderiales bacterium]|nr:glycoside hydrolase family 9 protein [Burkholderiales bacterium]
MHILHNHLGYLPKASKVALLQAEGTPQAEHFVLIDASTRGVVHEGRLAPLGRVANWRNWQYWSLDFSAVERPGRYVLAIPGGALPVQSEAFEISPSLYDGQLISNLVHYFKSQRCTGIFDQADRHCRKLGTDERVDVHGGWYDASGDASKYLSHLSYANFMNPQQTPLVVWHLADGRARMPQQSVWLDERMVDEALHGADFLARMQDASGCFYMTVFDRWSKDIGQREICSYETQQGHKYASWQAGFRQGGGMTIAALARASRLPRDGEFPRAHYLAAAARGFAHLARHNADYLGDGAENIIDDYCALLAATELYAATDDAQYATAAEQRARALLAKQDKAGWFWADAARTRSFFHAADAGLPYIALMRYAEVAGSTELTITAEAAVQAALDFDLINARLELGNPFGYPRQHVEMPGRAGALRFFIPHDNESGYWWQGENARLASLAAAAFMAAGRSPAARAANLRRFAHGTLDWLFGRNPFDACMMQGQGHHNPQYEKGYFNAPGGVCNGITAGLDDEDDIDFRTPADTVPAHSWRWSEQWLPHAAWLYLALAHAMAS